MPAAAMRAKPSSAAASEASKKALSFLSSLSLAEKFAVAGPVIAIIGFFLPFVTLPDFALGGLSPADIAAAAEGQASPDLHAPSVSLFGLARYSGAVYFILLGALASAALFYLARSAAYARKMVLNGVQIMIGSMVGPGTILALVFASIVRSIAGIGFWIVGIGFCCIVVGGLLTTAQLAKAER
jgi:hypothetical protein